MKRKALICAALATCTVLSGCEAIGKELSIVPGLLKAKTEITAHDALKGHTDACVNIANIPSCQAQS